MTKIVTSTGATLEFKDKKDVAEIIEKAEEERERIALESGIDPDKVQIQHISMDSFDFGTPNQILKHNTKWKSAEDNSSKKGRKPSSENSEQ